MVRNKASNDEDFVPPTQYPKHPKKTKRKAPPEPKPVPNFNPLPISNNNLYRRLNILEEVNASNPYAIFKLFFTDKLLERLAQYTNCNAELNLTPLERQLKKLLRPWKL